MPLITDDVTGDYILFILGPPDWKIQLVSSYFPEGDPIAHVVSSAGSFELYIFDLRLNSAAAS
jgi:hypothetical protein